MAIHEIASLSVSNARTFFEKLQLGGQKEIIGKRILKEIIERLGFLENVGLAYLLTLQHELALLVAVEQVYRVYTIKRGEPYHRE